MSAVPKLRFPEFDGGYKKIPLKSIAKIYDGTHQTPKYVDSGIPFFSVEQVTSGNFEKTRFIAEEVYEKECRRVKIEQGDILMTRIGDIGSIKYIDWAPKASFYVSLALLKISKDCSSNYLSHYMRTAFFQAETWRRTIHVAFPKKINLGEIGECNVAFPSLPEQQKIASFLSSVDKKIDLLRQKKDALEIYKKGLMQKIFSQEIRFKQDDGSDFPDWEEVALGDYSSFLITNSLSRSDLDTDGVVQNIHYGDIHTRFSCQYDQCSEATPYISDTKIAAKLHKRNQLQRGDIVIADASEDYADIGKAIEIVRISDTPLFAGLHTIAMRPGSNKFAVGFGSYLFQSAEVRRQIHRLAQGAKILGLSKGNIQRLTVRLPCVDEQKKIAEFISALDRQSNRLVHIIEHIETFKKGLLQQMFV